ncbi:MAG: type I restriction endonuclease [Bacteroidales bacterium]|nr:type I restriction endonuclease [Bacteroidales bacterium]
MDFKDQIKQFAERISSLKENILTEEATKNAFIMPFIQILGYDVFNPMEVIPEMDCDLIKKKGDKLDYAIMQNGEPILLIECKHWQQNLDLHATQLQKYFVASKAKFGLLTNGIVFRFYADLEKENIMDEVPFLEVNMESLRDTQIEELKKFHKSYFDVDNILSSANELKYMSEIKKVIRAEFSDPSAELVKLFTKRVYEGAVTQKILDQFMTLTKRALASHINDILSERLNIAIQGTDAPVVSPVSADNVSEPHEPEVEDTGKPKIVTTEEELEGFYIVKSICREVIESERITYRDAQSYFAIFADDNNRRSICRLYFNSSNKRISTFGANKEETKYDITKIDDIFNYSKQLKESASLYAK